MLPYIVSSTEAEINTQKAKAWKALDRRSVTWKSDRTDKIKRSFFQEAVVLILLYGCSTCTLTKQMEKKAWRQLPKNACEQYWSPGGSTPQSSNSTATYHLLRKLSKLDERTGYEGHSWRSRDEVIRDVLLWTLSHGRAKAGRPSRAYLQQLCVDTECNPETCRKQWTIGRGGERGQGYPCWWWFYLIFIICLQWSGYKYCYITLFYWTPFICTKFRNFHIPM